MDFDDAFANAAYIPGGEDYPDKWAIQAAAFRDTALCELDVPYGEGQRERFDLFHPPRLARGVVVFIHGGYWLRFDKSFWSHLAAGPLAHGWAVAMPSYDLCPQVRISEIGMQIERAIAEVARRVLGPILLTGHSAGGQLAARMSAPRNFAAWQSRVERIVPISAVTDLAQLMQTKMNAQLRIDTDEAASESPINLPAPHVPVHICVGGDERPIFIQQSQRLSDQWGCPIHIEPNRHHFDVVEELANPESTVTRLLFGR